MSKKDLTLVAGLTNENSPFFRIQSFYEETKGCDTILFSHVYMKSCYRKKHDFISLDKIDKDFLEKRKNPCNAINDGCDTAIRDMLEYAEKLKDQGHNCNALFYVVAESRDCGSVNPVQYTKKAIANAIASEALESFVSIFVGIGDTLTQKSYTDYTKETWFSLNIPVRETEKDAIMKLPSFLAKAAKYQNEALGTGGPSQKLLNLEWNLNNTPAGK